MSKPQATRTIGDNAALAKASRIRTSARKLNLVAESIRGMPVAAAVNKLTFLQRRVALDVKKVLMAAIANAEHNHDLDIDRLYVAEATVGRALVMRRFQARGRGRSSSVQKPFSNLRIVVREGVVPRRKRAAHKTESKTETVEA